MVSCTFMLIILNAPNPGIGSIPFSEESGLSQN